MSTINCYWSIVENLAVSLASQKDVEWSNVKSLKVLCKDFSTNHEFTERHEHAAIALGIFCLKSNLKFEREIVEYLLTVLRHLHKLQWKYSTYKKSSDNTLPVPENFTFMLNTVLWDIFSTPTSTCRQMIVEQQFRTAEKLHHELMKAIKEKKDNLFTLLSVWFGFLRSLYRCKLGTPLIYSLVPSSKKRCTCKFEDCQLLKHISSFISIIPKNITDFLLQTQLNELQELDNSCPAHEKNNTVMLKNFCENDFGYSYFCTTVGSSFSLKTSQADSGLCNEKHLKTLFELVEKMLSRSKLADLDSVKKTDYPSAASLSDVARFIIVNALYNVKFLVDPLTVSKSLLGNIHDFTMEYYVNEVLAFDQYIGKTTHSRLNAYRYVLGSNAALIQLRNWSLTTESQVEQLRSLCQEKIFYDLKYKFVVAHLPLYVACIQTLGDLGTNYSQCAGETIDTLRLFLLEPAPVFLRLVKGLESSNRPSIIGESLKSVQSINAKYEMAFCLLRDTAITAVGNILLSYTAVDPDCTQAFIANLSNRLFNLDVKNKKQMLVAKNAFITLGKLAVLMSNKTSQQAVEAVLQIFQRSFRNPASELDVVILDQLACMCIANYNTSLSQEIMNLITSVIIEGSTNIVKFNESELSKERYVYLAGMQALCKISAQVTGEADKLDLLTRLLEVFVQIGLEARRVQEKSSISLKTSGLARTLGAMIPILAIVAKRVEPVLDPKIRLHKLFRDFWLYSIIIGFTSGIHFKKKLLSMIRLFTFCCVFV